MGHSISVCPNCDSYVMEGHHDWECDCGHVMSILTGYVWKNPDGLTLKQRYEKNYKESDEYKLLTERNFELYIDYVKDCKNEKELPMSFKGYIDYLSFV